MPFHEILKATVLLAPVGITPMLNLPCGGTDTTLKS